VFVGVEDVAAVTEDEVRDGSDQAFLVGTADEENGAGSHDTFGLRVGSLFVATLASAYVAGLIEFCHPRSVSLFIRE
jgi:hypothetical protein